jgi:hypothetical protein
VFWATTDFGERKWQASLTAEDREHIAHMHKELDNLQGRELIEHRDGTLELLVLSSNDDGLRVTHFSR